MSKNRSILALFAGVSMFALVFGVAPSGESQAVAATSKLKLLWSQEFNDKAGTAASTKYFKHDLGNGFGWGNAELEYYTDGAANMATDGKGNMVIMAKRIPDTSAILNSCDNCQFTSAKVTTAGKLGFKYGRIEARIKTAAGSGMWPAFWMLGSSLNSGNTWPDCGEIDILEGKGSEPNRAYGTVHGPGYFGGNGTQRGSVYDNNAALSAGYHTYAIEW
ncbi:MAG: family 16 glycosylhydrolase, partial [Micrococcales bacterium]